MDGLLPKIDGQNDVFLTVCLQTVENWTVFSKEYGPTCFSERWSFWFEIDQSGIAGAKVDGPFASQNVPQNGIIQLRTFWDNSNHKWMMNVSKSGFSD